MLPHILYIHGFNSSPDSFKASQLVSYYAQKGQEERITVPELSYEPAKAMATLEALVQQHQQQTNAPLLLVGSSLGGFYATYLVEHYDQLKAVLVNPAVKPYELLADWLGDNENIYTAETYCLTREHLQQLISLDCSVLKDASRYFVLLQTLDETLDYRQAAAKFKQARLVVEQGGNHSFDGLERYYGEIFAFIDDAP